MNRSVVERLRATRRWWLGISVGLGLVVIGAVVAIKLMDGRARSDNGAAHPAGTGRHAPGGGAPGTGGAGASPLFDEVSPTITGVRFVHRIALEHSQDYLYDSGYACGGVCLGDINGDQRCDIFLASGPDENALFLNRGNFVFERAPVSETIAGGNSWGVSASMADVDGDGDLDLFVCNYDTPNRLWRNDGLDETGRLRFTECTLKAGLFFAGPSLCPYFADFDGDGDLDLFLLTNRVYCPFGRPRGVASELGPNRQPRVKREYARFFRVVRPALEVPGKGKAPPPPFMLEYGHPDRLYRNVGVGEDGVPRFEDVTRVSGIDGVPGHGLSALVWDINRDGRQDIYVANDYSEPDRLWLNLGPDAEGALRFRDAADEFVPYTTWSSMGSDVADADGDGRLDFMVADMAGTTHYRAKSTMGEVTGWRRWVIENGWPRQSMRNMLFLDSAAGRFREAAYLAGVARSDWTWAVKFADFDLDGRNDLFLTTGAARVFTDADIYVRPEKLAGHPEWEVFRDAPEMREKNLAFRNTGRLDFTDVSRTWNLDKKTMSYGAATGDLDGDGDLDLVICNLNENVSLFRNHASERGAHWLRVRLEGADGNRFGLGALVTARLDDGTTLVRPMSPQTGFLSGNEPVLHFGLGAAKEVASLEVRWPSGRVQQIGRQATDRLLLVREGESKPDAPEPDEAPARDAPKFAEVAERIGLRFRHEERPFDDYRLEPLLPGKLSQFGPGVAVADVNRDGRDDVFVGGAAGQAAALFVQQADHTFQLLASMPWADHADREDMGALWFDADRDGDLDLYVVSGSNEWLAGDEPYADRLYLNQSEPGGSIRFDVCANGALPDLRDSGSCVVGADFDRDGDVDLFVGSRSVPGQYPLTPNSTLLRNDGAGPGDVKFRDVTDSVSPALRQVGLVTGALWSDADGDGWPDLLVTCEWGPVRLFLNRQGQLVDATLTAGLGERRGWWNAIAGGDFDRDGDIDYATLNVGRNTKYDRPTPSNPVVLYRGDMDGNGIADLIEATVASGAEWPVRGRTCTCLAMPLLRQRFPTYKGFAAANLAEIYGEKRLQSSTRVIATELESGLWINESTPGQPRFTFRALPLEAQISPGFGVVAADLFGDGAPSIALAQNLSTREPLTGLWRGGLGCVMRPSTSGSLFSPDEGTGLVVSGDGRGLALADLNADGRPDLVACQNDDALLAFQQLSHRENAPRPIVVRLDGPPGNPLGFGARVSLLSGEQTLAIAEIHGGAGYLSQSTPAAFFTRPADSASLQVRVLWPNGAVSTVPVPPQRTSIRVPIR